MALRISPGQVGVKGLVIGISTYDKLQSLEFSSKNSLAVYDCFKSLEYNIENRHLSGRVNSEDIKFVLNDFFHYNNQKANDILVLYFSGFAAINGIDVYLVPSDGNSERPYERGVSIVNLLKLINESLAERVVTILDCYSSSTVVGGLIREKTEMCKVGASFIISCQEFDNSYSSKTEGISLFTFHLLNGLNGAAGASTLGTGVVTLSTLCKYLSNFNMNILFEISHSQESLQLAAHPTLRGVKPETETQTLSQGKSSTELPPEEARAAATDWKEPLINPINPTEVITHDMKDLPFAEPLPSKRVSIIASITSALARLLKSKSPSSGGKKIKYPPAGGDIEHLKTNTLKDIENYGSDTYQGKKDEEIPNPDDELVFIRYPVATFPYEIPLGFIANLDLVIKSSSVKESFSRFTTSIKLIASANDVEIPLHIIVEATKFDVIGKYYITIPVPVTSGDSEHVIFKMKATKEGIDTIHVRFFQQETYVGHLKIKTKVVNENVENNFAKYKATEMEWGSAPLLPSSMVPPGPDMTLLIYEKSMSPNFEYNVLLLSSEMPVQELGLIRFTSNPEEKFRRIFEDIENTNLPPNVIDDRMRKKGFALYEELVPPALKDLYWKKRDKIKSIRVISKEPWIPWEIIKPWRELEDGNIEEDEFLCERFSFARWLMGEPERIKTQLSKIKVIAPSDINLPNVPGERDWIYQFGNRIGVDVSFDSNYDQVIKTLEQGDYDVLHFSTHGKFDSENPLFSALMLENGILLRAEDVGGTSRNFGKTAPMILLNACQTGSQGFSLTGIQSWATRFLDSGASIFIGTLWSVSDDIAFRFVQVLYEEFSKGVTLGEAVRQARNSCKVSGDSSWLAYQLYGHPNSKINFSSMA